MLPIPLPTTYLQIPDFLSGGKGGFTPVVVVHVARAKSLVGSLLVLLMFAQGSSIGFNISIRGEHTQWASDQWQHLKRGNRYLDSNLVAFPNRMDGHMRFYADFVKSFHLWLCFVFFSLSTLAISGIPSCWLYISFTTYSILSKLQSNASAREPVCVAWWVDSLGQVMFHAGDNPYGMSFRSGRFTNPNPPPGWDLFVAVALVHLALICLKDCTANRNG